MQLDQVCCTCSEKEQACAGTTAFTRRKEMEIRSPSSSPVKLQLKGLDITRILRTFSLR
jgi:hypothetical protein